jgi:hypothetical protein
MLMRLSAPLLSFVVLLSGAAFAQQSPPADTPPPANADAQPAPSSTQQAVDVGAVFDKLNTSHTGKLTKAEAAAMPVVAKNFDAADTNHDGVLTKDEFMAAFKPQQ